MNQEKLNEIFKQYAIRLQDNSKGQKADLRNANLNNADLSNANLRNADLSNANLRNANLLNPDLDFIPKNTK